MRIRTEVKAARNGTGNIVARSSVGQKTIPYDRTRSRAANLGAAAGALMAAKGITFATVTVTLASAPKMNQATFDLR